MGKLCKINYLGSTNDEFSAGVDVDNGLVVNVLGGDDRSDDLVLHLFAQLLQTDLVAMLHRHHHGVHSHRHACSVFKLVLACDLPNFFYVR